MPPCQSSFQVEVSLSSNERCRSQNHMGASNLFNDALGSALSADASRHTSLRNMCSLRMWLAYIDPALLPLSTGDICFSSLRQRGLEDIREPSAAETHSHWSCSTKYATQLIGRIVLTCLRSSSVSDNVADLSDKIIAFLEVHLIARPLSGIATLSKLLPTFADPVGENDR